GSRLLVVTTGRGIAGQDAVSLGPLEPAEVAELVGASRAARLHARSGGNPLLLTALAAAGPEELPATVRAWVDARAAALGAAGATLRTAAVLGREIDVDLLAVVLGLGVRELLTHLDDGVAAGLVDDRGAAPTFSHDLVREALADGVTAARRAFAHREAARVLAARSRSDPLAIARHARLGGDPERAAQALVAAGGLAVERHDLDGALDHLDAALKLADGPGVRAARARVHLMRLDLDAAAADAERALGADPAGYELAGWIAYYRRDYEAALRFAEIGREHATDDATRASCALLVGRLRHTRGDLGGAAELLTASAVTGSVRPMGRVWLASLRCHQGRAEEASVLAERALIEPELTHPFAAGHALFAATYARGLRGDAVGALQMLDRFDRFLVEHAEQAGRFVGIAANLRGWVLRALGCEEVARECNAVAAGLAPGPMRDEPRVVASLDLADGLLAAGDLDGAAAELARSAWVRDWHGSMSWRQRDRHALLTARLALATGDAAAAEAGARGVLTDADGRGVPRYRAFAEVVAARAAAAQGSAIDHDALDAVLAGLPALAGLEAWWVTAEAAAGLRQERWWALADRRAAVLVAAAGPQADTLRRAVAVRFAALGRC
ncbi:MAG: hypothetical protein L0H84_20310, partial [Pseudonocardia sp.]|nr:hypothetical protein [Pseudonocardia sp.]